METQSIHQLKLHESLIVHTGHGKGGKQLEYRVTRVPGGWIYKSMITDHHVFVPFNKEFIKEQ